MTPPVDMTKGRAALPLSVVAEQDPFFIALGGPKAHDSSGRKQSYNTHTYPLLFRSYSCLEALPSPLSYRPELRRSAVKRSAGSAVFSWKCFLRLRYESLSDPKCLLNHAHGDGRDPILLQRRAIYPPDLVCVAAHSRTAADHPADKINQHVVVADAT
jgi:hypothetical protein